VVVVKDSDLDEISDRPLITRTRICVTKAHGYDRNPPHPMRQDCQKVSQILARIGEKWSMLVVMLLRDAPSSGSRTSSA
jgi:hypothetical protein